MMDGPAAGGDRPSSPGIPTGRKGVRESSPGPLGAWPPGDASAPRTHLTLVYNFADMIKWQVDGLQVVCLTVTQFPAAGQRTPQLACDVEPSDVLSETLFVLRLFVFEQKRVRPSINDGADALAFTAVAPAVLTRSECDAKGA